ncbi:MAG: aspartate-semialdehyde dehydrogenase, partial [Phycisphaerales bacterium]|nr:aspartate-semialdehyde dehydrogenase [Phycisphaerales bacterium]
MSLSIAVVGATGAVGREMLAVLEQRRFPLSSIRVFASPRSAGGKLPFKGGQLTVEPISDGWHTGIDCALLSAGSSVSKSITPAAAAAGIAVIDNSSAFRMDPDVPLVVPEINADVLPCPARSPALRKGCIVAVPNCTAIILLMGLTPLHRAFGVERVVVSTYQAASGAGAQAMAALQQETRDAVAGQPPRATAFHEPYAFNLFSHNAAVDHTTGLNGEEQKVIDESRKIWNAPGLRLSVTCVRVPVMRAHCESVNVTLKSHATLAQVRAAIEAFPGVRVVDDRLANRFPTPHKASGGDDVLVGRL